MIFVNCELTVEESARPRKRIKVTASTAVDEEPVPVDVPPRNPAPLVLAAPPVQKTGKGNRRCKPFYDPLDILITVRFPASANSRRLRNMYGTDHKDPITVAYGTVKARVSNKGEYLEVRWPETNEKMRMWGGPVTKGTRYLLDHVNVKIMVGAEMVFGEMELVH